MAHWTYDTTLMMRRGHHHRRGITSRWTCPVCKRRTGTFFEGTHEDYLDFLLDGPVCVPCGEWLATRLHDAVQAVTKELLAQVREVRKLERLTMEDA